MYHPSDPAYIQTKKIKSGEYSLPVFWQGIVDWITASFGVVALNVALDCYDQGNSQDIEVILERTADRKKLQDQHDNEIAAHIMPLLYSPERPTDDNTKTRILKWEAGRQLSIHISCYSFEEVYLMELTGQLNPSVREAVQKKYRKVIDQVTANSGTQYVFYHKETDVVASRTNGVSANIKEMYFDRLKQLDKFGYFSIDDIQIIFDSQEELDKNYGGNLGYYFR